MAKLRNDELAKPHLRRIVVSLPVPDHAQNEGRQPQWLRTGAQIEILAKLLDDRFLDACHKIARCHGVQYGKAMRKCQPQTAPPSSRGQFVIDESPSLVAIDHCGVVQLRKSFDREAAPPHRMSAPCYDDVAFLGERFHDQTGKATSS